MKRIYLSLFASCCFIFSSYANPIVPPLELNTSPGFIITKDAKIITGKVAKIFYKEWGSELVFINDMGRAYELHPSYIFGFAIQYGEHDFEKYESKYQEGIWRFLSVEAKGKHLSLYRSPSARSKNFIEQETHHKVLGTNGKEHYLETRQFGLIRIFPITYKKTLRNHLEDAPELLDKLGTEGYKFKNLQQIVEEYNEILNLRGRRS